MRRHRAPIVTRRQPNWLLVCAMLALSVHALANMGLMPSRGQSADNANGPFFAEICTGKGMFKVGPNSLLGALADAAGHEADCCDLSSLTGGPALTSSEPAQAVLALALGARFAASLVGAPARPDWALQAPRGPPLLG